MTLSNNLPPPEGEDRESNNPHPESFDLVIPPAPRIGHHRILLDAYLENCRKAFVGTNELFTDTREMSFEAEQMFANLAMVFRKRLANTLTQFGKGDMIGDLTCRMLHPVVAVGKGGPEYHLYVDVVNSRGRCVLADSEGVQSFISGPASLQIYATEARAGVVSIGMIRLISAPAFREAVNEIIVHSFDQITLNPRGYVALGWIMGGVCSHRAGVLGEGKVNRGPNPGRVALNEITNFRWMGGRAPAMFEFQIRDAHYKVQLDLDSKAKRPSIVVFEEFR